LFYSTQGWEEWKSPERGFFVGHINIVMITAINFSGSNKIKHPVVIGNPAGYYHATPAPVAVPVHIKTVGN
jgi:hypothetical protein